jgi:hypothetical protein
MSGVNPQSCDVTSFKAPPKSWRGISHGASTKPSLPAAIHISGEEHKKRFEARIHDSSRHWKPSLTDFEERQHLRRCSTEEAPRYLFRNYPVAELVVRTLDNMRLKYPAPSVDISQVVLE